MSPGYYFDCESEDTVGYLDDDDIRRLKAEEAIGPFDYDSDEGVSYSEDF